MTDEFPREFPSPAEVMRTLREVDHELEELSDSITEVARASSQAKHQYELAKAKALIKAKAATPKDPAPVLDAKALVAVSDEYMKFLGTQAVLDAARKRVDIAATRVTAFQTVMKTIREGGG
jgi:ElaB/YqjD/DUF883 family membrane-anchored ribosome-binding protein